MMVSHKDFQSLMRRDTLWNASAYGVFMASSITVAVMHALCMLLWNFLLASKRKWHCCVLPILLLVDFHASALGMTPKSQSPDFSFMFHLSLFFSSRCICKNTDHLSHHHRGPLWRPLSKGKDQNRSFCPRTNYVHSQVDKDMLSLCSHDFFFPPCVMVEVARRVLAAALHSNRC